MSVFVLQTEQPLNEALFELLFGRHCCDLFYPRVSLPFDLCRKALRLPGVANHRPEVSVHVHRVLECESTPGRAAS